MIEKNLPFPRGRTYGDGVLTLDDTSGSQLEGKLYEVKDTLHGTGIPVVLRVVKNEKGSTITADRLCLSFAVAESTDFGRRVDGIAGTAGEIAKPVDDYYKTVGVTTFLDNDLFYLVESGMCDILTSATGTAASAGELVQMKGTGLITKAGNTDTVIGVAMETLSTASSTACLVNVMTSLWPGHAAG